MIPFLTEIKEASLVHNLDPLMVASVVRAESNFNPNARSPVGALGLMQLMPKTDLWIDGDIDGTDPEGNLDNGCMYLSWLRRFWQRKEPSLKFRQEDLWPIVWGSYNAGQGNIKKVLDLSKAGLGLEGLVFEVWSELLPKITGKHSVETVNYVRKIRKFWEEYKRGSDEV